MRISSSNKIGISSGSTSHSARARSHKLKLLEKPVFPVTDGNKKSYRNIKKITSRLRLDKSSEIPPDLAARVVKSYILPMFESDIRGKLDTLRSETYGHRRHFSQEKGTVYSELKLSEKLSHEIFSLEYQLATMDQTVKDNTQEMQKLLHEKEKLELDLINSNANVLFLTQENLRLQRELSGIKLNIGHMSMQIIKYKGLYEEVSEEKEKISKILHEEKATNDIRLKFFIFLNSHK